MVVIGGFQFFFHGQLVVVVIMIDGSENFVQSVCFEGLVRKSLRDVHLRKMHLFKKRPAAFITQN